MNLCIGTKLVKPSPMTRLDYNNYRGWELLADEDGSDKGFLVEYIDGGKSNHPDHVGYISWSPEDVFHNAYRDVSAGVTFGHAVLLMKQGKKMARSNWNGLGMLQFSRLVKNFLRRSSFLIVI